ncbi:MAG: hypothetical protein U9O98_11120 [Asgard group archaeon]|nr:hypothetical protein [Asgard group archaeon]
MQKAVIVCLEKPEKFENRKNYVSLEEFNEMLKQGWEVEVQDPIGTNYNLIILEKE